MNFTPEGDTLDLEISLVRGGLQIVERCKLAVAFIIPDKHSATPLRNPPSMSCGSPVARE